MEIILKTFRCCMSKGKDSPEREQENSNIEIEKLNKNQIELIKRKKSI